MAQWSLTQCCSLLSRQKQLSKIPITLACATSFLVLVYISLTSDNFFPHNKTSSSFHGHDLSPSVGLQFKQHDLVTSYTSHIISDENESAVTSSDEKSNTASTTRKGDHLFVNNTDTPAPSGLPSSSESTINYHQDVYYDKEIFLQNYEEMKANLKVYIYPHKRNEPFANSLLPVDQEPGGNYASEAYFKNVIFKSPFVTKDPSKADLFYLPFSIASLRHDRRVGVGGLKDFVKHYMINISRNYPYWNRSGGADHFYVACHSIGRMAMEKVDHVKSNAIQIVCSSSYFLPYYFAHKDVCLPQIWPRHNEPPDLGLSQRKKLAFFAGSVNAPVRKAVLQTWQNDSSIFAHSGRLKTPYSEQLLGSKYCLHLKGYEVNTARIGDAIYYGCVPVIIADHYDLPFMDILNWKSFSVVITSSDIPNLKKILLSKSPREYAVLQDNVLKVRKHFQWNRSPRDFDAFYMVMYELWLRRSSIRILF